MRATTGYPVLSQIQDAFFKRLPSALVKGKPQAGYSELVAGNYRHYSGKASQVKSRLTVDFIDWENENSKLAPPQKLCVQAECLQVCWSNRSAPIHADQFDEVELVTKNSMQYRHQHSLLYLAAHGLWSMPPIDHRVVPSNR